MEIKVDKRVNRTVIDCFGKLDAVNAPEFEKYVLPLITEDNLPLFFNFAGVKYLASAGIRSIVLIISKAKKLTSDSGKSFINSVRFENMSQEIKDVFSLAGIEKILNDTNLAKDKTKDIDSRKYQELIQKVRDVFPAPSHDPMRDGYFIQSIARGIGKLDKLKTDKPFLGVREELDYDTSRNTAMPEKFTSVEESIEDLADYLNGLFIWGHPRTQENVLPPTTIPSIVGYIYSAIYNPNIISDELSQKFSLAEIEVGAMCSSLIGYDQNESVGISTFGGTGTIFYGIKLGIEKAVPDTFKNGLTEEMKVVASDAAHYAKLSALGWLGIGLNNVINVPTDYDNSMDIVELEKILRENIENGKKIATIISTMGTTDAFGIDNLEYIVNLRDKLAEEYDLPYKPHIHADAVIGWAWTVFNDYDFDTNPMGFSDRTLRSLWDTYANLNKLHLADSVGIDFHKTGYSPYVSSVVLIKDKKDLDLITRAKESMPYLFQFGNYHPGFFTMETSRSGGSVLSALANLKFLGKEGYRVILGHIVSMAEHLREKIENHTSLCLVNNYNYGPVTLFRAYPDGINAKEQYIKEINQEELSDDLVKYNDYNRKVFEELNKEMESGIGSALSLTEKYRESVYGKPVAALKSFVMSPMIEVDTMDFVLECIEKARAEVNKTWK